jgi:predicted phosphate transport protein (TIGR00153 family)
VRLRFTPRDTTYFDLLAEIAKQTVTGATLLAELLGASRSDRQEIVKRLSEAEHDADDATHAIMRRLNRTFVTPFDRDDIYALASALDDCMDAMDEAGHLIVLYRIDELPLAVSEQVQVLQRCAELTADAMPRLRKLDQLPEYCVEINRLENQGDTLHRALLGDLFDRATDAIALIKLKEVVDVLEEATDAFERVANLVETIALKES